MLKRISLLLARLFLGGVFAYAGYSKLMEPVQNFQARLAEYPLIPDALLPFLAAALPWFEWLVGVMLIAGVWPRGNALTLSLVSLVFAAGILLSGKLWAPEAASACGCFGEGGLQLSYRQTFVMDLINVVLGFLLFRAKSFPASVHQLFASRRNSPS